METPFGLIELYTPVFQYSGTHAGSSAGAGGHSHSVGSFSAFGYFPAASRYGEPDGKIFSYRQTGDQDGDSDGRGGKFWNFNLNSGTMGGATNTVSNHSHTITNQNTGGGKAYNNLPPYLVVNMWKRTK